MTKWIHSTNGTIVDTTVDGIRVAGTYYLLRNTMDPRRNFLFGAEVKEAGHTASVQLFAEIVGVKMPIGDALVPTFGVPAALTDELTMTGERGIIVTALTGSVFPEVAQ